MRTGQDLVDEARRWRETPFVHAASIRGLGADCVGLILGSARNLGWTDWQAPGYSAMPDPAELERYLLQVCDRCLPEEPLAAGDILLFTFAGVAIHLGLYTGDSRFLHAFEKAGRVVESALDPFWAQRCVGVYRWKGLAGG